MISAHPIRRIRQLWTASTRSKRLCVVLSLSFPPEKLFVFWSMAHCFFGVLSFYKSLQAGQAGLPEDAILFEPRIDGFQRLWVELVKTVTAFPSFLDQMSAPQQSQVFRNGGARNRKGSRDLSGRLASLPQEIKNGAAGRVSQ